MAYKVTLVIPINNRKQYAELDRVEERMTEEFGGCTTEKGNSGFWENDEGRTEVDQVALVWSALESYTDSDREVIHNIAQTVKNNLGEDSVMGTVEEIEEVFFI